MYSSQAHSELISPFPLSTVKPKSCKKLLWLNAGVGLLENVKNEPYLQGEVLEPLLWGYMEGMSAWLL